jgi:NADPH:quinone reductase-like Zn-dependent oxidoreductase
VSVPSLAVAAAEGGAGRWRWPIAAHRYDTAVTVAAAERQAIEELGADNLRRLGRHDPAAVQWGAIRRLLRPLDEVTVVLDATPTTHRRRAAADAIAVVLLRCAGLGRSYWGWTHHGVGGPARQRPGRVL